MKAQFDLRKTRRIRYLRELEKGPKTARQLSDKIGVTTWSAIRTMERIVDDGKATDTIERNVHVYTIVDGIIDEN
jgi:predicted ArsR family transcriptional regulator